MSTRCSAHVTRRPDRRCLGGQPAPPPDDTTTPPPGRFVQIMAGEIARFASTHALGFDDRCLLEHLLLAADHRSGVIAPFSLTDLARDLGLGPSGRRTLRGRLERLVAAGAITWTSSNAGGGRLEVLVYSRLVHGGAADGRRGFVQLVPSALGLITRRHELSPTAAALLCRLLLIADARSRTVAATTATALQTELALGWRRLRPALDELATAGLIDWIPGRPLVVRGYAALVRVADSAASVSPPVAARSGAYRVADDEERAAETSETRARARSSSRERDQDTPPTPPAAPFGEERPSRGWGLLAELATTLTEPQRLALRERADRGHLAQLGVELDRLLEGGWDAQALMAHVGAPLPGTWRSPARLLCARARALPTQPPDPEELRAAAAVAERTADVVGARNHARNLVDVDFLDAGEIVAMLAQAYRGDALEAALAVVATHRPEEDIAGVPVAAPGAGGDRPGSGDVVAYGLGWGTDASSGAPTAVRPSLPSALRRPS